MERKINKSIKVFLLFCLSLSLFSTLCLTKPNTNVAAQEPTPTPEVEPRIVGGQLADPGEYPWQVALIGSNSDDEFYWGAGYQFCGGALIDPYWVLTAAHCVTEDDHSQSPASSIDIVAGLYNLEFPASGFQRKDVAQIIRHPNYDDLTFDHDIALMRLTSPVILGGSGATAAAMIALAPADIGSLANATSWVTGWGKTRVSPVEYPTQLHEVSLPIISNAQCSLYWGGIIAGNICAGNGTGKDSCSGDSGGPLVINQGGTWIHVGIVSSGAAACGDYPGIYTRTSYYRSWIDAHLAPVQVSSILRAGSNPTNASSITFNVTFSKSVSNVDVSDFSLTTSGVAGASISQVNGSGSSYTVTVNTGSGDGTIRLDVVDDDSILDSFSAPLGGVDAGNGNFTSGEVYTIDKTPPTVLSITRVSTNPSNMLNVSYTVTFSESVIGVDNADFTLSTSGVAGAFVSNVSGSGNTRIVSVSTGQGSGTIHLSFVDNDSVTDLATNPTSSGLSGATYTINKPQLKAPVLRSPRSGGATNNTTPNFVWQRVAGAQSYNIQIANDNNFVSIEHSSNNITGTNYNLATLSEGTYYWRIQANDISGNPGKWSAVRTIIIDTTGPAAPTLASPADAFNSPNRVVTFRWQGVIDGVQYHLQIDNNSDFSSPEYIFTLRGLIRRMTLPSGTYYWCVQAKDAQGNWGTCSVARQIIIP
ncbi:MAG: trypsin-like serine protease [Anaerolineales bacterium]|nr:trypsin-like serine protease [Anaerolineales bacterium]